MAKQIPFHHGLFYYAMVGLIGREPDKGVRLGIDGFYEWRYIPRDDEEKEKFPEYASNLREWLDLFQITFSGTRCEYGRASPGDINNCDVIQVRIQHPVKHTDEA